MDSTQPTDRISDRERLLLAIAAIPLALLSLAALITPEGFARIAGAVGAEPYLYRLVGAAALGYVAALVWALRGNRWTRMRLLVAALLGFSAAGALGALLQLLIGDSKGIVIVILALGLLVAGLTAYLLYNHRAAPYPAPNVAAWIVAFCAIATLLALPFALAPLFFPQAFARLFAFSASDLLLYRLGGAELAGYVVLGALEVQSRNASELHAAAIMVLFFNLMAVVASLLALFTGEQSTLVYVVLVVSGVIAALTLYELARRTSGRIFRDVESPSAQPTP